MTRPPDTPAQQSPDPPPPRPAPPPPLAPLAAVPVPIGYASAASIPYESARPLARWAIGWLWVAVLMQLVLLWPAFVSLAVRRELVRHEDVTPEMMWAAAVGSAVESVASLTALVSVIFWLIWVYRTYRNLRPLGAEGLRFSPGWAVAYYLIPFVNLVRPFQVMRETWRASDPRHEGGTGWQYGPEPVLVNWWWALYLLALLVAVVWFVFEIDADDRHAQVVASAINVSMVLLDLVLFVIQVEICKRVTVMQEERAGRVGTSGAW